MTYTPTPAPRYHQDGWTPKVQTVFLDALIASGSVREAARACGKTTGSAYKRRAHEHGAAFKAAWVAAIAVCTDRVRETAMDRVFTGHLVPVFWRGEQVGEKRVYNDRLLIALMRLYDAPAYHAERVLAAQVALAQPPQMTQAEYIRRFNEVMKPFEERRETEAAEIARLAGADTAAAGEPEGLGDTRDNIDSGVSKEHPDARENNDPGVSKERCDTGSAIDAGAADNPAAACNFRHVDSGPAGYPIGYSVVYPERRRGTHDVAAAGPRLRPG